MMEIEVKRESLIRIWNQLNAKHRPGRTDGKRTAHLDVLKEGWGASWDIQDILYETDDRADLLVRHNDDLECLLVPYNIHFETRYRGPFSNTDQVYGHRAMRAADLAMYIMEVERLGFTVDPIPIVSAIRPHLIRQKHVTNGELSVIWYLKQRHRFEPIILRVNNANPERSECITTHSGYKATALLENNQPVVLRVDASLSRKGFPLKYWIPCELGEREIV